MAANGDAMDVDFDIDFTVEDEPQYVQQEDQNQEEGQVAEALTITTNNNLEGDAAIPEAYKEDFDADFPVKEKVHLRGLDNFNPEELKQYLYECNPENPHRRIEWVNDTSANVVYHHADQARIALANFTESEQHTSLPVTELRPARRLSSRPEIEMFVRQAFVGDKKVQNARLYSRFYLQHPEHDPEMREHSHNNRRRGNDRRNGPRQPAPKPFTEDMYGDSMGEDEAMQEELPVEREIGPELRKRRREGPDLFEGRETGRLRERSRSPTRDGDGRFGFEDDQPARKTARRRSWNPPVQPQSAQPRHSGEARELFPSSGRSTMAFEDEVEPRELFSGHTPKRSRELFPNRTPHSNHRRNDALDKEETRELVTNGSRSLADRITGGPNTNTSPNIGFTFKGAADQDVGGFNIRGASREVSGKVKELFPSKVGNGQPKELFPNSTSRGNNRRRRAEELL